METVIWLTTMIPPSMAFFRNRHICLEKKKPMWFLSGTRKIIAAPV